jgi:hypothetical protein
MHDHTIIFALKTKRAEISAQALELEERLNRLRQQIANLDGTLQLYGVAGAPKLPSRVGGMRFARNELGRFILRILQGRDGGLTCRAMAEAMFAEKGWDTGDAKMFTATIHRIGGAMHKLKRRGFVEGTVGVWRLAGR